eukprot:m51a1_g11046 putative telomerase reverse transcriptase (1147) ;mRNA; f:456552-494419
MGLDVEEWLHQRPSSASAGASLSLSPDIRCGAREPSSSSFSSGERTRTDLDDAVRRLARALATNAAERKAIGALESRLAKALAEKREELERQERDAENRLRVEQGAAEGFGERILREAHARTPSSPAALATRVLGRGEAELVSPRRESPRVSKLRVGPVCEYVSQSYYEESDIFEDVPVEIRWTGRGSAARGRRPLSLRFKIGETVQNIKMRLAAVFGAPYARTTLMLDGRAMMDPLSLNDFPLIVQRKRALIFARIDPDPEEEEAEVEEEELLPEEGEGTCKSCLQHRTTIRHLKADTERLHEELTDTQQALADRTKERDQFKAACEARDTEVARLKAAVEDYKRKCEEHAHQPCTFGEVRAGFKAMQMLLAGTLSDLIVRMNALMCAVEAGVQSRELMLREKLMLGIPGMQSRKLMLREKLMLSIPVSEATCTMRDVVARVVLHAWRSATAAASGKTRGQRRRVQHTLCLGLTSESACGAGMSEASMRFPNTLHNLLIGPDWELLLSRVGDPVMVHVLLHEFVFCPLPRGCFLQVSGPPVASLVSATRQQGARAEVAACLLRRMIPRSRALFAPDPIVEQKRMFQRPHLPKTLQRLVPVAQQLLSRHLKTRYDVLFNVCCPKKTGEHPFALYTQPNEVVRFLWLCVKRVVPPFLLGSRVKRLVELRRKEQMSLAQAVSRLRLSRFLWLTPTGTRRKDIKRPRVQMPFKRREELSNLWVLWLMCQFVVPLIRRWLYCTDTAVHHNRMFYYRKDIWRLAKRAAADALLGGSARPITNMSSGGPASTNASLRNVLAVLSFERDSHMGVFKNCLFSLKSLYPKLLPFILKNKSDIVSGKSKLFYAACDVSRSYDTLDQSMMLRLVEDLLERGDYVVQRFSSTGSRGSVFQRRIAFPLDHYPQFHEQALAFARRTRGVVFSDAVILVYGSLETKYFPVDDAELLSTLVHFIDDFLFLSIDEGAVGRFLEGSHSIGPDQGMEMNQKKTKTNFSHLPFAPTESLVHDGHVVVPWCGFLFRTDTLEVLCDYSRYSGTHIADWMTVVRSSRPGEALRQGVLSAIILKMNPILFDSRINSRATIVTNLYQCALIGAIKFCFQVSILQHKDVSFLCRVMRCCCKSVTRKMRSYKTEFRASGFEWCVYTDSWKQRG